jgi:hypothetical protein
MITLPSHTSHVLQLLYALCLKSFKTAFRKESNGAMAKNNYIKLDKIMLTRWIDKALNQTLTKKNITSGFRTTEIWPLNPKVTDKKLN